MGKIKTLGPNVLHNGDPFSALMLDTERQNARTLYKSLTGNTLSSSASITAGHKHDSVSLDTQIDWLAIGQWNLKTQPDGNDSIKILWDTHRDIAVLPMIVPTGVDAIFLRYRHDVSSQSIDVRARIFEYQANLDSGHLTENTTTITATSSGWVTTSSMSVSTVTAHNSLRLIMIRVAATRNNPSATAYLSEIQAVI